MSLQTVIEDRPARPLAADTSNAAATFTATGPAGRSDRGGSHRPRPRDHRRRAADAGRRRPWSEPDRARAGRACVLPGDHVPVLGGEARHRARQTSRSRSRATSTSAASSDWTIRSGPDWMGSASQSSSSGRSRRSATASSPTPSTPTARCTTSSAARRRSCGRSRHPSRQSDRARRRGLVEPACR